MASPVRNQRQVLNELRQKTSQLRVHCRSVRYLFSELFQAEPRDLPNEVVEEIRQDVIFISKVIADIEERLVLE